MNLKRNNQKKLAELSLAALLKLDKLRNRINDKIEKPFQKLLFKEFNKCYPKSVRREVSLNELKGKSQDFTRPSGYVDFVIHRNTGIEVKVILLPKHPSRSANAIYDLGQITMDMMRLKSAKEIRTKYLIWVLRGVELRSYDTPLRLKRHLHNRLFVDYIDNVKKNGKFNRSTAQSTELKVEGRRQAIEAKKLGLDTTFSKRAPLNSANVVFSNSFAAIVLEI